MALERIPERAAVILAALAAALLLGGCGAVRGVVCEPCREPIPAHRLVGINPATMACQRFDAALGEFVGPFLPVSECAGKPRPIELPDDESG